MNAAAERLLSLAAVVDSWPEAPRPTVVVDVLAELDLLAFQLGRLVIPDEPPQSLHQSARALNSMTTHAPTDLDGAEAVLRVATRCLAAAHRALERIRETP